MEACISFLQSALSFFVNVILISSQPSKYLNFIAFSKIYYNGLQKISVINTEGGEPNSIFTLNLNMF
jgi:hypothetical protein